MSAIKIYIIIGFCVIIELLNIVTSDSVLNLLLTIPELLYVCFLILKRDFKNACFFNILFTALCFNPDFGLMKEDILYSYAKIKLVGPLTISYLLGGLVWFWVRVNTKVIKDDILLNKFRWVVSYLLISASLIGLMGVVFLSYPIKYFAQPLVYILNAYIYLDILTRLYEPNYIKKFYYTAFCLIIASPIATTLSYFILGVYGTYSVFDALITNEVYTFVPCLIIALLFRIRFKALCVLALICYFANMMVAARGGYYLMTLFSVVICIYLIYFSNAQIGKKTKLILRVGIPAVIVIAIGYMSIALSQEGMSSQKLNQIVSLGNLFFQSGDYDFSPDTISSSPYIRIGEVLNIVYEGVMNPLGIVFGKGYGGYWTDALNLFPMLDLTQGGFAADVVQSGRFRTAHSVIPTALLYNGVVGLFFLFRMGVRYMKNITKTPLIFISGALFFYSFYYDPLLVIVSVFILFGAEYKLSVAK